MLDNTPTSILLFIFYVIYCCFQIGALVFNGFLYLQLCSRFSYPEGYYRIAEFYKGTELNCSLCMKTLTNIKDNYCCLDCGRLVCNECAGILVHKDTPYCPHCKGFLQLADQDLSSEILLYEMRRSSGN